MSWQIKSLFILLVIGWGVTISYTTETQESFVLNVYDKSLQRISSETYSESVYFEEFSDSQDSADLSESEYFEESDHSVYTEQSQDDFIRNAIKSRNKKPCFTSDEMLSKLDISRLNDMLQAPLASKIDVIFFLEAKVFYLIYSKQLIKHLQAISAELKHCARSDIKKKIHKEIDGLFTNDGPFKKGNPWEIKAQIGQLDLPASNDSLKFCYLYELALNFSSLKMIEETPSRLVQLLSF